MRSRNTRRTQRRIGMSMIATSLVLGSWSVGLGAAVAQEEPQAPEEIEEAEVERVAYYQAPTERILPATLVSEFPPGVVCIVRPELCPDSLEPVTSPVEDGLGAAQEGSAEAEPEAAPMPDDAMPVSSTGGQPDYRSAFQFALPTVPEGQQVDSFKLYLTETEPSYSGSSPAFRQAVLAALTCARGCDEDQFEKIGDSAPIEEDILAVEVCPIPSGSEWEEGDAQKDDKMPQPDCLYGANGVRIGSSDPALWEFDLTFTLQAIAEDQLDYNGFLVRPANLPNLAHGDPDTTYNKQVVFAEKAGYTMETSEAPEPVATLDLGGSSASGGASSSSSGFSGDTTGGSSAAGAFSAPGQQTSDEAAAAPQVAEPAGGGETAPVAGNQQDTTLAAGPGEEAPSSAWWIWSLVPIFLGGMYLTTQSLMAAPLAAGTDRAGAMTRLIEKRQQAAGGPGPELVQF